MNRLKPTVLGTTLAGLALLTSACSTSGAIADPTPSSNGQQNGIVAGNLEVTAANNMVKLRNTTENQIGYMVVDKDQMVVALYPPCNTQCPMVKQGETVSVPYSQINGYTSKSTDAVVLWWKYTRRADGTLAPEGAMQNTNVKLK